jgi:hypothetical protein
MEDKHACAGVPVRTGAEPEALARIPRSLRDEFPGLEAATDEDEAVVRGQLGKKYQGEILVARRCPHSKPAVVLTIPLAGDGGPVPPLLWLTCPNAVRTTGTLESSGAMAEISSMLDSEAGAKDAFMLSESTFANLSGELARSVGGDALASRSIERGVAGGPPGAIKCLHAHVALCLSRAGGEGSGEWHAEEAGPGRWCIQMLEERGGPWCERPPAACVV